MLTAVMIVGLVIVIALLGGIRRTTMAIPAVITALQGVSTQLDGIKATADQLVTMITDLEAGQIPADQLAQLQQVANDLASKTGGLGTELSAELPPAPGP